MDAGDRLGRYEVRSRLGAGGFADVFLARDPMLDTDVAVKVLAMRFSDDDEVRDRFVLEAQLLRRIGAEHVISVFDIGEVDGRPYFVMEHLSRGTLADRVDAARQRAVPASPAVLGRIVADLASGMGTIHATGVVHRDIKPSNLLLRGVTIPASAGDAVLAADERVVVGDFGFASVGQTGHITVGGGTAAYMPPEQWAEQTTVSPQADLYAASAVVLELATLVRPKPMLGSIPEVVRTATADAGYSEAFTAVLLAGLAPEPDDRPDSARAWADALLDVLARERPSGQTAIGVAGPPEMPPTLDNAAETIREEPAAVLPAAVVPVGDGAGGGPTILEPEAASDAGPVGSEHEGGASPPAGTTARGRHGFGRRFVAAVVTIGVLAGVATLLGGEGGAPPIAGPERIAVGTEAVFYLDDADGSVTWRAADTTIESRYLGVRPTAVGALDIEAVDGDRIEHRTVEVVRAVGIAIEGPAIVAVGSTAEYVVAGSPVRWTAPASGEGGGLRLTGVEPGPVELVATVGAADGEVEIRRAVTVVP